MMVGTRLALPVAKVTATVATQSPRPPTKMRSQGRLLHQWVLALLLAVYGSAAVVVSVMARLLVSVTESRHDRPVSSPSAAISPGGWLQSRNCPPAVGWTIILTMKVTKPRVVFGEGDVLLREGLGRLLDRS